MGAELPAPPTLLGATEAVEGGMVALDGAGLGDPEAIIL